MKSRLEMANCLMFLFLSSLNCKDNCACYRSRILEQNAWLHIFNWTEQQTWRVLSVNISPFWAWCLHSMDWVSSEASPWWWQESFSPPKRLCFQFNISRTHWCLIKGMDGGREDLWVRRWVDDQMKIQISLAMCPPSCWFGGPLYKHPLLNYSLWDRVYKSRKVKPEATSSNNYDH